MRKHDPSTLEHDISVSFRFFFFKLTAKHNQQSIRPRPLTIADFTTASNENEDDMPTYDPSIDGRLRQISDSLGGLD